MLSFVREGDVLFVESYSRLARSTVDLLYSSFHTKKTHKNLPWYEELSLSVGKKMFIKRLFGIKGTYENIGEVERDFITSFKI